jgi:hypothetical protein
MDNLGADPPLCNEKDGRTRELIRSARISSQNYRQEREDAVTHVRERLRSAASTPIDTICMLSDGVSWVNIPLAEDATVVTHHSNTSPEDDCERGFNSSGTASDWSGGGTIQFKRQYINRNTPCVIRDLDLSYFEHVTSLWRTSDNGAIISDTMQVEKTRRINTEWFRCIIGNDTIVPVRYPDCDDCTASNNVDGEGLDDEGRARECNTRQMSLDEWISKCQNQQNRDAGCRVDWYLKDWHLLQFLANQDRGSTLTSSPSLPLYTTPKIFERDILNRFLERCCADGEKGGDYKFVYWGPAGSRTSVHSDVLHSFSWSYNVVGMKKWIFHVPQSACNHNVDDDREDMEQYRFEVIQHAGETIFVPSTWKHEVVNLVETLSINHNWITSANIDQAWICIQTEIAAIEEEVQAWGVIPTDDFEAREGMLRGCIGLDCTMFTLMVLLEIVELLQHLKLLIDGGHHSDDELWDCIYSIFRLGEVLVDLLQQTNLVQRLTSGFGSESYAREVESIANHVISFISKLTNL